MAKQGKCNKCKRYFSWDKDVPFKKLCCPTCAPSRNTPLKPTTYNIKKYTRKHLDNPPLKTMYLSLAQLRKS